MSTRDFMISDIHGHRITSQLKAEGWEIFLLAPVAGSTAEFKLVAECGSLGSAISLAKELNGGKTVEEIVKERAAAEEAAKAAVVAATESAAENPAEEIPTDPASAATSEPIADGGTFQPESVPVPTPPAAISAPPSIEVSAPTVEAGISEAAEAIAEEVAGQSFGDGVDGGVSGGTEEGSIEK